MEKKKYILQTPTQFSFDVPALNITQLNVPHEVSLTEEEVRLLNQSIPNIKIVLLQPTIPSAPAQKAVTAKVTSTETAETITPELPTEPTVKQTIEVTTTVTQDVPASEVNPDGTANPIESSYLSVSEASIIIKNLKTLEELQAFLSNGESRKGLLDEYNKRLKELS